MNEFILKNNYYEMVLNGKHKGIVYIDKKDYKLINKYNWTLGTVGYARAYININKKRIRLGRFKTKDEAIQARILAEEKYFGEYKSNHS